MKQTFFTIEELYQKLGLWQPAHPLFDLHNYQWAVQKIAKAPHLGPYQCNFYQLSFFEKPNIDVEISSQKYMFNVPCFIITSPGSIHDWSKTKINTEQQGFILFFDGSFLDQELSKPKNLLKYPLLKPGQSFSFPRRRRSNTGYKADIPSNDDCYADR